MCAVSRCGPIGVDLEKIDTKVQRDSILRRFDSPQERKAFSGIPVASLDLRTFLARWCRKEAALKSCGIGLTASLAEVEIGPEEFTW
ncbi:MULTISPECIES: 4'-phosphopantetheinyl transferase family protein [unclassified Streptomyces]